MVGKEKIQVVLEERDHPEWGRYWRVWPSLQMGADREAGGRLGKPRDTLIALPQLLVLACREDESWKKKQPGCQSLDSGICFSLS